MAGKRGKVKGLLRAIIPLTAILAVALAAYGNTFHVPFVLDDVQSIVANPLVRSFAFTPKPRILADLSFNINYRLHGLYLPGFHLGNLLLHSLNGLLLYLLLRLTLGTPLLSRQGELVDPVIRRIPLAAALLFVSHPLQTQAVTYLTQRHALLACFFCLISLLAYAAGRLRSTPAARCSLYLVAMLAAGAAILSKENAIILPPLLLLYGVIFFPSTTRRELPHLAFFALPVACGVMFIFWGGSPAGLARALAEHTAEAGAPPRLEYLLTQFGVVATYLRLLILPYGQSLDHDVALRSSLGDPAVFLPLLLLAGIAILGIRLWRFSRKGGECAGQAALAAFAIGWFSLALSVESGLVPLRDAMAEHRLYLPMAGVAILPPLAICQLLSRGQCRARGRGFTLLVALIVMLLGVATWQRNRAWQSEVSIWQDAAMKNPMKGRTHGALAHALQRAGRKGEAEAECRQALRLSPLDHVARNNLGVLYLGDKRHAEALGEFLAGLETAPDSATLHGNAGLAYAGLGRYDMAEGEYRRALLLLGGDAPLYNNLGIALARQGRGGEAAEAFRSSLSIDPANKQARENLARLASGAVRGR